MNECIRCGRCCKEEICPLGEAAFGHIEAPCPALMKENEVYSCEFVITEKVFFTDTPLADTLGIGKGCDAKAAIAAGE